MTRMQSGGANAVRAALSVLALVVALPAAAQNQTELRVWTAVSVRGQVSSESPWRWAADSLVRTRDGAGTIDFVGEWVSVNRDLTRRSSVGVGYIYGAGFQGAKPLREHRLLQQYVWGAGGAWRVSLRSRLEERFVTGRGAMLRMHQQVRVTWPLTARGALRGIASEEVFVRANSTALGARGFDANQLFVGIGWKVTARSSVEVGYVNVYSLGASSRKQRSHVLSATLVVSR